MIDYLLVLLVIVGPLIVIDEVSRWRERTRSRRTLKAIQRALAGRKVRR